MKNFLKAGPGWSGFFLFGLLTIAFSSCQTSPKVSESVVKKETRKDGPTRSYIGLTKKQAIAKAKEMGLRSRIVRDDFERFPMTKDLRSDRINFEIDKGLVTVAKIF